VCNLSHYPKTMLILGAGFSKNFRLPLTSEILTKGYNKVVSEYPNFQIMFLIEWLRLIGGRPFETMNYEEMLSRVDLEITYISDYSDKKVKYSLWKLRDSIIQVLWEALNENLNQDDIAQLDRFFTRLSKPVGIISFNQDLLIETYFERRKIIWSYGIPVSNFTLPRPEKPEVQFLRGKKQNNNARVSPTFNYYHAKNPAYILLKMHGSFNWQFCPNCHDVQILPLVESGAVGRPYKPIGDIGRLCAKPSCMEKIHSQSAYSNLIVPPTVYKNFDNPLLRNIWEKAKRYITKAKSIYIIGYSFSSVDVLANWMLFESTLENNCLKEIVIIDPDENVKNNIERLIPKKYHPIIKRENSLEELRTGNL